METIESLPRWRDTYREWAGGYGRDLVRGDISDDYPFVVNKSSAIVPLRRALPLLNLALITSAGGYIDGTESFDTGAPGGDVTFREIPVEVEEGDMIFAGRGYDPGAVNDDWNAQVPLDRLNEFAANGIIGGIAPVFWSFAGFIPDAARFAEEGVPRLVERVKRYEVKAALLVPASRLCHQSCALAARALETAGVPTLMLAVERDILDGVRPPRACYYKGEYGSVAGTPRFPEHQRRILDEALRSMESTDQPSTRRLAVEIETAVEHSRGER